jgi:hypothetical protein
MASEAPTEGYGRGMRQTRRSQRAKEADLNLTGIQNSPEPSISADPSIHHEPSSPEFNSHSTSRYPSTAMTSHSDSTEQHDSGHPTPALPRHPNMSPLHGDTIAQQVFASIENQDHDVTQDAVGPAAESGINHMQSRQAPGHPPIKEEQSDHRPRKSDVSAQPSARSQRVTKPQKSRKKKKAAERAPTEAPSKRNRPSTPQDNIQRFMTKDQLLQPGKLMIYDWDYPIPKDFLNLSKDLKAAKARVDVFEGENDRDPELDDWHEFCGLEADLFPGSLPLKSSIGLNFTSRAKRAYRAGRSWTSFELEERAIDSRAGARALIDPVQRDIALSSSLSNTLRLYVFEEIKVRLCHEIWLQPYPEAEVASMRDSAIGTAAPTPAASDKTALELAAQRMASLPDRLRTMVPGTALPIRTQPELPGRDRELHQPEGPRIRATQANLRGLGVYSADREAGVHLDMATSEE